MERLLKKYMDLGVKREKIRITESPSICIWSTTRKALIGGKFGAPSLELINEEGNVRLSTENNVILSLQNHSSIDVERINNSAGIIITDATYGTPYFRFAWIPEDNEINKK